MARIWTTLRPSKHYLPWSDGSDFCTYVGHMDTFKAPTLGFSCSQVGPIHHNVPKLGSVWPFLKMALAYTVIFHWNSKIAIKDPFIPLPMKISCNNIFVTDFSFSFSCPLFFFFFLLLLIFLSSSLLVLSFHLPSSTQIELLHRIVHYLYLLSQCPIFNEHILVYLPCIYNWRYH